MQLATSKSQCLIFGSLTREMDLINRHQLVFAFIILYGLCARWTLADDCPIGNRYLGGCMIYDVWSMDRLMNDWRKKPLIDKIKQFTTKTLDRKAVVCYWASWAVYRGGYGNHTIDHIDPAYCTHLVYSFAGLNLGGGIDSLDLITDITMGISLICFLYYDLGKLYF